MRWAVLLGLAACTADDPKKLGDPILSTDTATDSEPVDTGTPAVAPALVNPAEAIDLDPAADVLHVVLHAAPAVHTIGDQTLDGYAYNGQTPGPTLRATIGDTLVVELENELDDDTTIHWHGLAVPYDMDGVTWSTAPIGPGGSFTYTFTLDRAGTFWYHPHFDTARQVDLGLYGVLIVEDPAEPVADDELVLVFDSWEEHDGDLAEPTDHHGLDPTPVEWTVNGLVAPVYDAEPGSRVRVRMVNVSNAGYLDLDPQRQIAGDQGLLPEAVADERILLAPGDRVETEWPVGAGWRLMSARHSVNGGAAWGPAFPLLDVAVDVPTAAPDPLAWPFGGGSPSPDPGYSDIVYVFTGEAGGEGWMINGELYPDVTVESLPLGAEAYLEVRNLSPAEHPFHLHGHHFEVLSIGGVPATRKRIEDTANVPIGEAIRIRLIADNPGDWMAHCHILPHAHQGMMTVLRVAE